MRRSPTDVSAVTWPAANVPASRLDALGVDAIAVGTNGATAAVEQARTLLENARAYPVLSAPSTIGDIVRRDNSKDSGYQQLANVVILVSLPIADCTLVTGIAAGLADRKRPFSLLRLTGARLATLRRVVALEGAGLLAANLSVIRWRQPALEKEKKGDRPVTSGTRSTTMRHRLTASAVTSLARWTPYLESEMCGLRTLVRPGSVCIDVGSAADLYTTILSRLAGPAGQVHSIEPLPFAHLLWARFLSARRARNVRHHCLALGTEAGTAPMSVPVGRYGLVTGRSYLVRETGGPDSNVEFDGQVPVIVSVDRLDDFCAREAIDRIDFVKIDVEGAELQVLEGGREVIEAHRPTMLIEIEARHTARYGHSPEDVGGWLFKRGYTMHTWRRGWREADGFAPGTRNYLFRAGHVSRPGNG